MEFADKQVGKGVLSKTIVYTGGAAGNYSEINVEIRQVEGKRGEQRESSKGNR